MGNTNILKREKCVLCDDYVKDFHKIQKMPSFMGAVSNNIDIVKEDMIFGECINCGLIQNINLLDQNLVYLNNHNTEIVGEIWKQHYDELSNFIKKNSKGEVILEIGDPSAKLAHQLKQNYKKWVIVEPNTNLKSYDNIEIINSFFDGKNPTNYIIETIVHSHLFEHIYNPIEFLENCFNILEEDGVTIFSIPNLKWLLENKSLPTSILHFEHTYYLNIDNIHLFLNKSGFELNNIYEYKNHSLFIKATKNKKLNKKLKINKVSDSHIFMELFDYFKDKIVSINEQIGSSEYYLYSAHINSQYLLNNGISNNIKGLLDNSESKIGKKLYGYNFEIFNPNIIKNEDKPIVVVSNMGVYFEEIKNYLLKINKNCVIL
jgi:hypothetical protein